MLKKLIKIKLGFWDNVRKYTGKKLIEIKLGFLGHERMLSTTFFKFNTVELLLFIAQMRLTGLKVFEA